jgi:N-acetyl-gamma-glutamyl-phosphate reductase
MKINVGIVGASGYSGEMLLHLLARHPEVNVVAVTSRKQMGVALDVVIPSLRGKLGSIVFIDSDPTALSQMSAVDVWFLALPHGVAAEFALPLIAAGRKVIDLSADFRLNSADIYQDYYAHPHPAPDLLPQIPYVLPEIARYEQPNWTQSSLIACPGCYPTSIQVPLYPLIKEKLIGLSGIVINSLSGVSGAGKKATEYYSFCERHESMGAYGAPKHRHLSEIEEQLSLFSGKSVCIQFTPHLIPVKVGIASTIVAPALGSIDALYAAWAKTYPSETTPFVHFLKSGQFPETRTVIGSNRVEMSAVLDQRTGNYVITSVIDNLIKGASGQAIQIMNLWFNLSQTSGLI